MNAEEREVFLTVPEAAEWLNTGERFIRRLINERRITFTRFGRHVRIPESALQEYIAAGTVRPMTLQWRDGRVVA